MDKENVSLVEYGFLHRASQRIQSPRKHDDAVRMPKGDIFFGEGKVVLHFGARLQRDEIKQVLILRKKTKGFGQYSRNFTGGPEVEISDWYPEKETTPPVSAQVFEIFSATRNGLVGAVNIGCNLDQIDKAIWYALEHMF